MPALVCLVFVPMVAAVVEEEEPAGPMPFDRRDLVPGVCLRAESSSPPATRPPPTNPPTSLTCSACFLELMCFIQAPWFSETVRSQLLQCFLPLLLVPGVAEPGMMGVESSSWTGMLPGRMRIGTEERGAVEGRGADEETR